MASPRLFLPPILTLWLYLKCTQSVLGFVPSPFRTRGVFGQEIHALRSNPSLDDFSEKELSPPSSGILNEMTSPSNAAYSAYTHLIAIPLEENHDLTLELESVQRAVLYHCPLLINACIVAEMTRMPMLYVDASSSASVRSGDNANSEKDSMDHLLGGRDIFSVMKGDGGANAGAIDADEASAEDKNLSRDPITKELHNIVLDVVNELIFSEDGEANPILMQFHGLEMDGDNNGVLSTIGTEMSSGTETLRLLLAEVRRRIEERGWSTCLPSDEPQGGVPDGTAGQWRPRVPFMRLPTNFEESLPPPKGADGNWQTYSDEEKAKYVRLPEEGGNGISPIFWYRWWDDDFPSSTIGDKGVRIRDVAIYARTGPFGGTEHAFYVPHMKVTLPGGDAALAQKEKQDESASMMRMIEKEDSFGSSFDSMDSTVNAVYDNDDIDDGDEPDLGDMDRRMMEALSEGGVLWDKSQSPEDTDGGQDVPRFESMEDEIRASRTDAERRMLEGMYSASKSEGSEAAEIIDLESKIEDKSSAKGSAIPASLEEDYAVVAAKAMTERRRASDAMARKMKGANEENKDGGDDSKKRDIVDAIRKPVTTGDWTKPKNKTPWQNNPIFKDWKTRSTLSEDDANEGKFKPLAPFPSDQHFVGPWRMVSSPTSAFDGNALFGDDPSTSENIILRVDGLVAGGPILDFENMHKAAGGTWRRFQAERIQVESEDEENEEQTRLRIRLVIPPSKERILVMEGQALLGKRREVQMDASSMVAPATFGIPQAEAAKETYDQARAAKEDLDYREGQEQLRCTGEVWIEDARTGDNRKKLGRFVLEKVAVDDPKRFVYSVPKPTRIQD